MVQQACSAHRHSRIPLLVLALTLVALGVHSAGTASATDNPLNHVSGGVLGKSAGNAQLGKTVSRTIHGESEKEEKSDFIIVPIPGANPTIGASLSLAAAYFYTLDEGSQASYTGVGAFASTNGSMGWAFGQSISWLNDHLRAKAVIGNADVRYDLYGVGNSAGGDGRSLPIDQTAQVYAAEVSYDVTDHIYLGVRARYLDSTLSFNLAKTVGMPGLPPLDLSVTSGVVGPTVDIDRRDSQFYPLKGFQVSFQSMFSFAQSIDAYNFRRDESALDYFIPVFTEDTVAFRAAGCHFSGTGPFFEECLLGTADALRGYPVGQYIDKALFSSQIEYRGRINKSWGYVGFAGFGLVGSGFSALIDNPALPSAGVGVRYRVSQENELDLSVDAAVSNNGTAIYVYLGQNF